MASSWTILPAPDDGTCCFWRDAARDVRRRPFWYTPCFWKTTQIRFEKLSMLVADIDPASRSEMDQALKQRLPVIYLARHGETAWSLSGQHTGRTDLPLTARGERNARQLGQRLSGLSFYLILASPLQRAMRTCALAGFQADSIVDSDLLEWDYGEYEGRRSVDIHKERPDWQLFRDGCPGGESPEQVAVRADRVVSRLRATNGDILIFSSGHFLRVLAARWLGLVADSGKYFMLSTASLSALSYEQDRSHPVIRLWDDTRHVGP